MEICLENIEYQNVSVFVSAWNNSALNGRIFIKIGIWGFFENLSREFKYHKIWQE
jgi:hypothetical protein